MVKNKLIVALDGMSFKEVKPILEKIKEYSCILKINDMAVREGLDFLLPKLSKYGEVMLDLKWHDIPNTLLNYRKLLLKNPPWAVTIHASAGDIAIKTLSDYFKKIKIKTKILAVTVLTSMSDKECKQIFGSSTKETVLKLAKIASSYGADGFVCSVEEARTLRNKYPKKIIVTPGIRIEKSKDDQTRVDTPEAAIKAGADYIVVGRPITKANNPTEEIKKYL